MSQEELIINFKGKQYKRTVKFGDTQGISNKNFIVSDKTKRPGNYRDVYFLNNDKYVIAILYEPEKKALEIQQKLSENLDEQDDSYGIHKLYEHGEMINIRNKKDKKYYAIMENGGDIDLFKYIDTLNKKGYYTKKNLSEEENHNIPNLRNMFWSMLKSLKIVHDKNYIHHNINPKNFVLYSKNPEKIKLVDFDFIKKKNDEIEKLVGTPGYYPPQFSQRAERKKRELGESNECIDIYSLGIVFLILITGQKMICSKFFKGDCMGWKLETFNDLFSKILEDKKLLITENEKDNLIPIIKKMMMMPPEPETETNPCKSEKYGKHGDYCCRYNDISEILEEPYFKEIPTPEEENENKNKEQKPKKIIDNTRLIELVNILTKTDSGKYKGKLSELLKKNEKIIFTKKSNKEVYVLLKNITELYENDTSMSKIKKIVLDGTNMEDKTQHLFLLLREYKINKINKINNKYEVYSSSLEHLSLRNCQINYEGMKHIAFGLATNKTLKTLDLSMNEISNNGVYHLYNALTNSDRINSTALEEINLSNNNIGNKGVEFILQLINDIDKNNPLKKIDLSDNEINNKIATLIESKAREKNIKLIIDNEVKVKGGSFKKTKKRINKSKRKKKSNKLY